MDNLEFRYKQYFICISNNLNDDNEEYTHIAVFDHSKIELLEEYETSEYFKNEAAAISWIKENIFSSKGYFLNELNGYTYEYLYYKWLDENSNLSLLEDNTELFEKYCNDNNKCFTQGGIEL